MIVRRRNMYYATGLPGWMRFGYSPGWVGRSPSGLGPCAEYLMSGQWPNPAMAAAMQGMPEPGTPPPAPAPGFGMGMGMGFPQPDPQQQLAMLQAQADMLRQQIEAVREQIRAMEGE